LKKQNQDLFADGTNKLVEKDREIERLGGVEKTLNEEVSSYMRAEAANLVTYNQQRQEIEKLKGIEKEQLENLTRGQGALDNLRAIHETNKTEYQTLVDLNTRLRGEFNQLEQNNRQLKEQSERTQAELERVNRLLEQGQSNQVASPDVFTLSVQRNLLKRKLKAQDEKIRSGEAEVTGLTVTRKNKWIGLTDEELQRSYKLKCKEFGHWLDERTFLIACNWAEAKLKEKNV